MSSTHSPTARLVARRAVFLARSSQRAGYHSTAPLRMPYKDDQDRKSLKPRAQEYSKSNGGDGEAAHTDAAFDPKRTAPEEEKRKGGSPLEVSPADKNLSQGKDGENRAAGQQKQTQSGVGGRQTKK